MPDDRGSSREWPEGRKDALVAHLTLTRGLVAPEALARALAERRARPEVPLFAILLEGFLTPEGGDEICRLLDAERDRLWAEADQCLRRGRASEALARYERLGTLLPRNPQVLRRRALAFLAIGQVDLAIESLDRASALVPEDTALVELRSRLAKARRAATTRITAASRREAPASECVAATASSPVPNGREGDRDATRSLARTRRRRVLAFAPSAAVAASILVVAMWAALDAREVPPQAPFGEATATVAGAAAPSPPSGSSPARGGGRAARLRTPAPPGPAAALADLIEIGSADMVVMDPSAFEGVDYDALVAAGVWTEEEAREVARLDAILVRRAREAQDPARSRRTE